MCGIAGLIRTGRQPVDPALLGRLAMALAHRGPDGRGQHLRPGVGFVQTRLAVIDLQTGQQPLYAADGRALVGNGEIYNHVELRGAWPDAGWRTGSDCEAPLLYAGRDGPAYVDRLRGMYALAIDDPATDRVELLRDPFGIKPLYLADTPHGYAFASEIATFLEAGLVPRTIDPQRRDELLDLQFTTGADTLIPGIRRLLPGERIFFEAGRITGQDRRPALPEGGPRTLDPATALDALDTALRDSVAVHCRADVPYGLFLSGGIDSSLILSYMAEAGQTTVCFTAAFDAGSAADERDAARATARACRAEHHEVIVTRDAVFRHLPAMAAAMDDPAADYAIIPTWLLARAARDTLTVVLSGEGGDELLGGYGRYRTALRPWWRGGRAMRTRGALERTGVRRAPAPDWRTGWSAAERASCDPPARSRLQRLQSLDIAEWLPNDLLLKLDRCLMAHALEGRTPFLDPAVAEAAWRLPDALKIQGRMGKVIARDLLARRLPLAPALAPKQGFTVPVGAWLAAEGRRLGPLVAHHPVIVEFCRPAAVEALFRSGARHTAQAAWSLLFYALWARRHVLDRGDDVDLWTALAER